MEDFALITLFFIVDGVLLIVLGVPLLRGDVSPNSWYGFRTKKTLSNEKIWYAVNRAAGKDMVLAGAIIIFVSLVLFLLRSHMTFVRAAATLVTVTLLCVAWMVIHGYSVSRRM